MADTPLNPWSPWMKALSTVSDDPQQGDFNMIEDAQRRAQAIPPQPSASAPPAHRIEDDRTAGTRGTTPQSPTTSYDPAVESRAYDPNPGRRAIARIPLETQINTDRTELDRMNQPIKTTLGQRIGGIIGSMATAGRGEAAMEQQATLADRAAARKQQERESLGSRISANTRALTEQDIQSQRIEEQERAANQRNTEMSQALGGRMQLGREQIASRESEGQANRDLKETGQQDAMTRYRGTQDYLRWKTQQDNATRLEIAKLRQQAVQNKAPAALMQTAVFAQGGIKSLNDAQAAMQKLEQSGVMGQSWAQNKVEDWIFGKGAVDPSVSPDIRKTIGELRQALNLSASAMTRAHTQRGSKEVYDDLKRSLGPGQDWSALRGAIAESQDMLGLYVQAASDQSISNIRSGGTSATPTPSDGGQKATHKIVNGKIVPTGQGPQ